MNEEEAGVQYLVDLTDQLESKAKSYYQTLERIHTLISSSVDAYYTLKMVQKMVEETIRLAHQGEGL